DLGDLFGQGEVGGQTDLRPRLAAILGADHRTEVTDSNADLGGWKVDAQEVALHDRVQLLPGCPMVLALHRRALLAGDHDAAVGQAGDREKGAARPSVGAREGLPAIAGVKDASELADDPAVLLGREARGEQVLSDLAARNRLLGSSRGGG